MSSVDLPGSGTTLERLGRYRIEEKLGQGGMGAVYLAHDSKLDRRVAIKVLPSESVHDPDAVARFQREAKALAKLSHPGIVQAFDSEEQDGRHFLVMEYVAGQSLADLLKAKGRVPPLQAADYVHQAALALHHAHQKGLIHRDIKPSNLLLTPDGQIKVLDLGLARFLQDQIGDPSRTREGTVMGTPDYMAPEQFRDARHVDARSDIYALGCTLYHLLTGRVPFPGTSLAEKCTGHEEREPPPVEELCPDAPAGLALVVRRMMAKHPADRFQTAGELAEALSLYVSGASAMVLNLKNTVDWQGSQLTFRGSAPPRRRRSRLPWAIAGAAAVALVVALPLLLMVAWPRLFPRGGEQLVDNDTDDNNTKPKDEPPVPPPDDPNVLTVAKTGPAKFRTIAEALAQVKPGQTIRVLDDGTYAESLFIDNQARHKDIVLEAPKRATLLLTDEHSNSLLIQGVSGARVSGFRFRDDLKREEDQRGFILLKDRCPGVVLEDLDLLGKGSLYGIGMISVNNLKDEEPTIVRRCVVQTRESHDPIGMVNLGGPPVRGIAVRDNRLTGGRCGIYVGNAVAAVQITGNTIWNGQYAGIEIINLVPGLEPILIANNTVSGRATAVRVGDSRPGFRYAQGQVEFCNNILVAGLGGDLMFLTSKDERQAQPDEEGAGRLAKLWTFRNNYRDVPSGDPGGGFPLAKDDRRLDKDHLLSRDPKHADFMRPTPESPLAKDGAGKSDPSLPAYVGAVPPKGAEAWDWRWTWDARARKLLTVSKDPKVGGRFRTICDAVRLVRPGMTIRVLDDADYNEPVLFNDANLHAGVVLEAPKKATLLMTADVPRPITIQDVPAIQIKGFRFRERDVSRPRDRFFVLVRHRCPGTILEDLDIQSQGAKVGIYLLAPRNEPTVRPIVIQRCAIRLASPEQFGIAVQGTVNGEPGIARGIILRDNQVSGGQQGLFLSGRLADIFVVGNRIWNCELAGIELRHLGAEAERILIANNSILGEHSCLRVWDRPNHPKRRKGQVEICNNVFAEARLGDAQVVLSPDDKKADVTEQESADVAANWPFHHNFREAGSWAKPIIPVGAQDQKLTSSQLLSRLPSHEDFLRPAPGSPLTTGGAGGDLPAYAGAVPPKGTHPWDWDKTWKARQGKQK
jgi:serine/threonine protein kinase/nitrous oxidase accessory protein NosD